ncbi:Putative ISL3 family ISFsp1-like transposase (plasmid) [Streptomyces clavuligerus]|uniref:Putative ISL3 family ISFsp1-like transposase n=1 Tax=Streptomyces clavuligerus TaxID=1901 RepID=D5SI26_STRCL|nr:Putative ISL3 family ISFsp1-like transposase [Streptomyces clavuligerus]
MRRLLERLARELAGQAGSRMAEQLAVPVSGSAPLTCFPDHTSDAFAARLREHPHVKLVCRDRGGAFADGAQRALPEVPHVAGRWAEMHVLRERGPRTQAISARLGPDRKTVRSREASQPGPRLANGASSQRATVLLERLRHRARAPHRPLPPLEAQAAHARDRPGLVRGPTACGGPRRSLIVGSVLGWIRATKGFSPMCRVEGRRGGPGGRWSGTTAAG